VVRGYRRKRFYTTAQRILTHLSSEESVAGLDPRRLTQEGVARSILSGRSTVTKALDRLERQALVVGERAHVPGYRVRKTVYRLTSAGRRRAEEFRRRLASEVAQVEAPGIGVVSMPVASVPRFFPSLISLTGAVALAREGRIDLVSLALQPFEPESYYRSGNALPKAGRSFGRTLELRAADAWFDSTSKCLAVTGIAGIGKTAFVGAWLQEYQPDCHVFWANVGEYKTSASFLADFATFLERLGRHEIANYLFEGRPLESKVLDQILVRSLNSLRLLVVLDGVEKATRETIRLGLTQLLRAVAATKLKLILVARTLPPMLSAKMRRNVGTPVSIRLGPLSLQASMDILRSRGIPDDGDMLRRIAVSARGHPLALTITPSSSGHSAETVVRLLEREVLGRLSRQERTLLEAASLFRSAAPPDILMAIAGRGTFASLQEEGLVERTFGGRIVVHDIIRETIREQLPPRRRRAMHLRAAKLFRERSSAESRLECLYQFLQAGRADMAARFLDDKGMKMLDSISIHEIVSLVKDIDLSQVEKRHACVFGEILGDGLSIAGDAAPALMQFRHTLEMCGAASHSTRISRILRKMASIERVRENLTKAEELLREAFECLGPNPDPAELSEALRELALVDRARGDGPSAIAHLNEAIDLATEVSDSRLLARSFLALGSVEEEIGNAERGIGYKLEGLRIAERSGNLTETARGLICLGTAYGSAGRHLESLGPYERALSVARLLGNLRLTSYAMMGKCSALLDLGRYAEAGPLIAESKSLFQILDEAQNLALLQIYEGQWEMGSGHWARARALWDDGLSELEACGDQYNLARSLMEVGSFYIRRGFASDGYRYIKKAYATAQRVGNPRLIQETESLLPERHMTAHSGPAEKPPSRSN
jgi:tetratricopeptide (TPR) repeat protein